MKAAEMLLIALMVALVAGLILLAGCTQEQASGSSGSSTAPDGQNGAPAASGNAANAPSSGNAGGFSGARNFTGGQGSFNASNRAGRNGSGAGMQNLTAAQRSQMLVQRMAQMAAACGGKSEGDACILTSQRGNMTGSCAPLNGTLACSYGSGTGGEG